VVYAALHKLAKAEDSFRRAILIASEALPPDHPNLAQYCASYAHLLRETGRKSEARRLEEQAKTAREHHARVNLLGYTVDARQSK